MKKLLFFAFASLFILSACGKKADKASAEQSHESAAIQEVKSDNAQETKPAEAAAKMPRAEKADKKICYQEPPALLEEKT